MGLKQIIQRFLGWDRYGVATFSSSPSRNRLTQSFVPVTSILLRSAAQVRANAVSSGLVLGVEGVEDIGWHKAIFLSEWEVYLNGCVYWRIRRRFVAADMPVRFEVNVYRYGQITRASNGDFKDATTGETIPANEIAEIQSLLSPPRATERLKDILKLESGAYDAWNALTGSIVKPTYVFTFPDSQMPKTPELANQDRENINNSLKWAAIPTYGNNAITALPSPKDEHTASLIEELRRAVSADSGVPAQQLGSPNSAQYANLGHLQRAFYEDVIGSEVRLIQEAVRRQGMLPEFTIDLSNHYAYNQSRAERALELDRRALVYERLRRGETDQATALELSGLALTPEDE